MEYIGVYKNRKLLEKFDIGERSKAEEFMRQKIHSCREVPVSFQIKEVTDRPEDE
jgi:hypothetical protein